MALTFKEFAEQAQNIFGEILPLSEDGKSGRHSTFLTIKEEVGRETIYYELVSVEPDMAIGCGCWDGIVLEVKRKKQDG